MRHIPWCFDHVKHILHLITNTVEPTLQATLQSQSQRTDLRITIVTTQNPAETVVADNTPIFSLSTIGYDRLMDLIFEAESIVTW